MYQSNIVKYSFIVILGALAFIVLSKFLMKPINSELNSGQVTLSAKVLKDDVFQLFYWESSEPNFSIEKSVRTKVKGSTEFQDIVFNLPELIDLKKLRLDIGENADQKIVFIEGLKFSSDKNEITFDKGDFKKLFAPNKYVKPEANGEYSGILGKSGEREFYDPYFISVDGSRQMESIKANKITAYPYITAALACLFLMLFFFKKIDLVSISPQGLFISAFFLILILPMLQKETGFIKNFRNLEKRELAKKPDFSFTKKFARDFESYFDDNFGLRNRFVSWGGAISKRFKSSKNPDLVMFGEDNWLFYNRRIGNNNMFKSYTRTNLLTPDSLKLVVDTWEKRRETYEAQSKKYLLVFWPNKHSIYPEKMSSIMRGQIKDTVSRADQLLNYIRGTGAKIKLTDVRPKLFETKQIHQVYYKSDSHWNDYGAFIGYQDFFRQNRSDLGVEPKSETDFDIQWSNYYGGELIQLLGVANKGEFKDRRPKLSLKTEKDQIEYLSIDGFPRLTVRTKNERVGNDLKVLVFRDSFTRSLVQFFSLHFHEVTYIWGTHKEYYVNKLQPDIIIDGFVEREIGNRVK